MTNGVQPDQHLTEVDASGELGIRELCLGSFRAAKLRGVHMRDWTGAVLAGAVLSQMSAGSAVRVMRSALEHLERIAGR